MSTRPTDQHAADPGRLRTMAAAIRYHRRAAGIALLVVLAAALVTYLLIPRRYTAHANLWLDHGFDELAARAGGGPAGNGAVPRNTEIRLLTSSGLAAEVVDTLGLANLRGLGQPQDGTRVPPDTARARAIAAVRDGLDVRATGTSYAVKVAFASTDPMLSTGILNQLVDRYVEDRRSGGLRGRERGQLAAQVAAARDEMIRTAAAVTGYGAATKLIGGRGDGSRAGREMSALETELSLATAARNAAEARLGDVRGNGAAGVTSARLRQLRARRAQLGTGSGDAADQDAAARAAPTASEMRLAETDRDIALETQRAQRLLANVRAARDRAGLLESARARATAERAASRQASTQLARLEGEAGAARRGYLAQVQRYGQFVATVRNDRGSAYVISHASVPTVRDFPNPVTFALGGLLAALLAAAAMALALETSAKGFRSRQDLERKLGIPVVGIVPNLAKVRGADLPGDDPMGPPDYLYLNERSAFSGAFRSIHTGLRLGGSAHSPHAIAVCSALPEEGKTTVAICLARSAAIAGLRVVLVDCDARLPAASRALTPYVEVGLVEVLTEGVDFRDALMRDTPSGAWFLAHSSKSEATADLIGSDAMAALVAKLAREFDLVVLDTAPALALAEARAVAAMADGVLLVARWRTTPVEATRLAYDMLSRAGAKVTVAALTMVDP